MKVSELQARLSKLDPSLEVYCYTEDEKLATQDRPFVIFAVCSADTVRAVQTRLDDGTPYFQFDNEKGRPVVTLEITGDF